MIVGRFPSEQLPLGAVVRVEHPPYDVLVANINGSLYAIEDACPHSGRSLSQGQLDEHCIVCPGHGWRVNLATGDVETAVGAGLSNPCFRVERVGDEVIVYER